MGGPRQRRRLPRSRPGAEARVPLHRSGFAVREHAAGAPAYGARRRGHLRRGRLRHGADPRRTAQRSHLHHVGQLRRRARRAAPRRDRGDAARRADGRHRHREAAQRTRHRAGHGRGSQHGRVRGPRRRRFAELRGCAPSGERPWPRGCAARGAGSRKDGRRLRTARGDRTRGGRDRWKRAHRQLQQHDPGGDRGPVGCDGSGQGITPAGGILGRAAARESRLPHRDRRPGGRRAAPCVERPDDPAALRSDRVESHRRLLLDGARVRTRCRSTASSGT